MRPVNEGYPLWAHPNEARGVSLLSSFLPFPFLPSFRHLVGWIHFPIPFELSSCSLLLSEGVWVALGDVLCVENFFSPAHWGTPLYPEERTPGVVWKRDWVYLAV
eukprot:RCo004270